MVVKSATKKKLMDLGIAENFAHILADDRKWDDVKILPVGEIAQICETDSETSAQIKGIIDGANQKGKLGSNEAIGPVTNVRLSRTGRKTRARSRVKSTADIDTYNQEAKLIGLEDELSGDAVYKSLKEAAEAAAAEAPAVSASSRAASVTKFWSSMWGRDARAKGASTERVPGGGSEWGGLIYF